MIVSQAFDKITGRKFHVIEFCEIENMRFRKHGGWDIQLMANFDKILEKLRVGKFPFDFIYELFADFSVCNQFSPNSHKQNYTIFF